MYFGSMYVELGMNIVHVTVDIGAVHICRNVYPKKWVFTKGLLRTRTTFD
jgi:hypothetical protein